MMFKRDVLIAIHNFSKVKSLAYNAKIKSSLSTYTEISTIKLCVDWIINIEPSGGTCKCHIWRRYIYVSLVPKLNM